MKRPICIQPSAIIWLSVLFYLKPALTLPFFLAAAAHELGHGLALRILGKPPLRVTLSFTGAVMETPPLGYREELWAAAAGPAVSLLLGLLLPIWPELGFYSLVLGLFNLLPICGLDGGRILRSLLLLQVPEAKAGTICNLTSIIASALLFLLSLTFRGFGLWPVLLTGMLLLKAIATGPL